MNFAFKTSQTSQFSSEQSTIETQAVDGYTISAEKCANDCNLTIILNKDANDVEGSGPDYLDVEISTQFPERITERIKQIDLSNLVSARDAEIYRPVFDITYKEKYAGNFVRYNVIDPVRFKMFFQVFATRQKTYPFFNETRTETLMEKNLYMFLNNFLIIGTDPGPANVRAISYYIKTNNIFVKPLNLAPSEPEPEGP
jgi:hypothetical protein